MKKLNEIRERKVETDGVKIGGIMKCMCSPSSMETSKIKEKYKYSNKSRMIIGQFSIDLHTNESDNQADLQRLANRHSCGRITKRKALASAKQWRK